MKLSEIATENEMEKKIVFLNNKFRGKMFQEGEKKFKINHVTYSDDTIYFDCVYGFNPYIEVNEDVWGFESKIKKEIRNICDSYLNIDDVEFEVEEKFKKN